MRIKKEKEEEKKRRDRMKIEIRNVKYNMSI